MVRRGEFESLQERGLPLGILVDTNSKARLGDVSKFVFVERFDFSRPLSEFIDAVREIQKRFGIACLYNVVEFYVAQTAEVARRWGCRAFLPNRRRLCLDKNLMRERFHDRIGPRAAARFQSIKSEADLFNAPTNLGYPCFLQPANVSASMWATRNADRDDVAEQLPPDGRRGAAVLRAARQRRGQALSVVARGISGRRQHFHRLPDG